MAVLHINLGDVASGKSTGIKNLSPETTVIIQGLKRGIPIKGGTKLYNSEKKNLFTVSDIKTFKSLITSINSKLPNVKTIVIDDMHYIFGSEFAKSAKVKGYDKYMDYFVDYYELFNALKGLRDDLFIHVLWHITPVYSGQKLIRYEPKFIGTATKKYYDPLGLADIITYAQPVFNDEGEPEYGYYVNRMLGVNDEELLARSPLGMFEENRVDNDLQLIETSYYNFI